MGYEWEIKVDEHAELAEMAWESSMSEREAFGFCTGWHEPTGFARMLSEGDRKMAEQREERRERMKRLSLMAQDVTREVDTEWLRSL